MDDKVILYNRICEQTRFVMEYRLMEEINGKWIMHGVDSKDPSCIKSVEGLKDFIEEIGFLPLFENAIEGFSVEEHTDPYSWWCGNGKKDPWEWRTVIAAEGKFAYGKFFGKKAGFISRKWFPYFANMRRDGYDFDSLWDDGKASLRQKKIMDLFDDDTRLFSYEIKEKAGFGKGGEKNFEGTMADLQMHTYLCMRDFKRKVNKKGIEYGWDVAIFAKPEQIFGYNHVSKAYKESPEESAARIVKQIKKFYPEANDRDIKKILKA